MDDDVFGKCSRLGRDAGEAVARAVRGGPLDPFLPAKCLDRVFALGGGLPSWHVVEREAHALRGRNLHLFAELETERAIKNVESAVRAPGTTVLDLKLGASFCRAALGGDVSLEGIVRDFVTNVTDAAMLTGRGGFVERYGPRQLSQARALLDPTISEATKVLMARPTAKRLRLSAGLGKVTPETDLCGGHDGT
mgnify:CR=1 FL=1